MAQSSSVSVFVNPAFRHCSAEQMKRVMDDPEAARAFVGEQAQETERHKVYHPAAAEFLRWRNSGSPYVPLSG